MRQRQVSRYTPTKNQRETANEKTRLGRPIPCDFVIHSFWVRGLFLSSFLPFFFSSSWLSVGDYAHTRLVTRTEGLLSYHNRQKPRPAPPDTAASRENWWWVGGKWQWQWRWRRWRRWRWLRTNGGLEHFPEVGTRPGMTPGDRPADRCLVVKYRTDCS